ncbi:hypothetical protein GCM10012287_51570 [Streptomyces daqingensis]|uniref:DUF397 domain-containing protein n=1 Tax=Streptomyces daqingensis TaxID=1472640 RepID=A0ABQ2MRK9_9ACTN|nr:DUF397 domain-containing protein [Streptomyces daqingensis]GGO56910.1 hypothetical protein GCM10012287_51570 [Streptomyces daqingensis]
MTTRVDLNGTFWRKSSYSNGDGGNCVEIAHGVSGHVPVRDSKHSDNSSPVLVFPTNGWGAFLTAVKNGRL